MRLLEKCGYIKKIYKENPLRKKGRKGATWRILYDPKRTDEDILAHNKPDFVERQDAEETLKVITKSQPDVDKQIKQSQPDVDQSTKKVNPQVDSNYSSKCSIKEFREISRQICRVYAKEREARLGTMAGWQNDERQEAIIERYLMQGHDKNVIMKTLLTSLNHFKSSGKRPPFSLAYYDTYFNKKEKPSVQDIIKKTANRSRFPTVRKPR